MLVVRLWTSHLNSLNLLFVFVLCTLMRLGQRIQLWDMGLEADNFKKALKLEATRVTKWKWFNYWKGFKPQLDYSPLYDHTRHWSSTDQPPNPLLSFAWAVGQLLTGRSVFPSLLLTCGRGESLGLGFDGVKSLSAFLLYGLQRKLTRTHACCQYMAYF